MNPNDKIEEVDAKVIDPLKELMSSMAKDQATKAKILETLGIAPNIEEQLSNALAGKASAEAENISLKEQIEELVDAPVTEEDVIAFLETEEGEKFQEEHKELFGKTGVKASVKKWWSAE